MLVVSCLRGQQVYADQACVGTLNFLVENADSAFVQGDDSNRLIQQLGAWAILCEVEVSVSTNADDLSHLDAGVSGILVERDDLHFQEDLLKREAIYWALEKTALLGHQEERTEERERQMIFFLSLFASVVEEIDETGGDPDRLTFLEQSYVYAAMTYLNPGFIYPVLLLAGTYDGTPIDKSQYYMTSKPAGFERSDYQSFSAHALMLDERRRLSDIHQEWQRYENGELTWEEYQSAVADILYKIDLPN